MKAIKNFPSRETVLLAHRLRDLGLSSVQIARRVGWHDSSVRRWFAHPERFDPYIDEVAINRALEGERKVYDAFTIYELHEFLDRLEARIEAEPYDKLLHYNVDTIARGTRSIYWLHDLENKLGLSRDTLGSKLRQRRMESAA